LDDADKCGKSCVGNQNKRLSFNLGNGKGGFRVGAITDLDLSTKWQRVIYLRNAKAPQDKNIAKGIGKGQLPTSVAKDNGYLIVYQKAYK